MASYDSEHNVTASTSNTEPSARSQQEPPPRRPDFSTFFSHVDAYTDTSQTHNAHATAMPTDISAAFRLAAEGFEQMRQDRSDEGVLDEMITMLLGESQRPPAEVKGVGQEFIDELERVPKKLLKPGMDCPICSNAFLEDKYPLVVRLPCNPKHMFDLECIAPWLKLHATCPMDRKNLIREKKPPPPPKKDAEDDEEGEYDDMYA